MNKVFVVGFNKCATTSLHGLFASNGMSSVHWDNGRIALAMMRNAISGRGRLLRGYDRKYVVFSDMIYLNSQVCIEGNSFFRVLDRDYPGSKFIYNTRSMDAWLNSRASHRNGTFLERYKQVLNARTANEVVEHWRQVRLQFERELFAYFDGRADLLVYDIESATPSAIAAFVQRDLDLSKFAWSNRTGSQPRGRAAGLIERVMKLGQSRNREH